MERCPECRKEMDPDDEGTCCKVCLRAACKVLLDFGREQRFCGTCKYFAPQPNDDGVVRLGHCRRYPPNLDQGFSETDPILWCGEYEGNR